MKKSKIKKAHVDLTVKVDSRHKKDSLEAAFIALKADEIPIPKEVEELQQELVSLLRIRATEKVINHGGLSMIDNVIAETTLELREKQQLLLKHSNSKPCLAPAKRHEPLIRLPTIAATFQKTSPFLYALYNNIDALNSAAMLLIRCSSVLPDALITISEYKTVMRNLTAMATPLVQCYKAQEAPLTLFSQKFQEKMSVCAQIEKEILKEFDSIIIHTLCSQMIMHFNVIDSFLLAGDELYANEQAMLKKQYLAQLKEGHLHREQGRASINRLKHINDRCTGIKQLRTVIAENKLNLDNMINQLTISSSSLNNRPLTLY